MGAPIKLRDLAERPEGRVEEGLDRQFRLLLGGASCRPPLWLAAQRRPAAHGGSWPGGAAQGEGDSAELTVGAPRTCVPEAPSACPGRGLGAPLHCAVAAGA